MITFVPAGVSGYLSKVALTAEIPSELGMFVYNGFKSIFTNGQLVVGGSQQSLKLLVSWHPIELTTGLPFISVSTIKHPSERTIFESGFKKDFNRSLTLLKSKYFLIILVKTVNFLFALMQILVMCSSNFNSLSFVIPNKLTVPFSHIISSFVQICFQK